MSSILVLHVFFFFKQKTAYEMRISDWSSDVCSSDLAAAAMKLLSGLALTYLEGFNAAVEDEERCVGEMHFTSACRFIEARREDSGQIGRASCRERVCQYV